MGVGPLTDALRSHLTRPEAIDATNEAAIEQALADVVRAGEVAWPAVQLPASAFVARIATHHSNDVSVVDWLRGVHAADLYLASACAERAPGAIASFDREFLTAVPAILARGGLRDVSADEVCQRVRERLFVGAMKIADYSGRGSLASWLQVVTQRIAIDAVREQKAYPIANASHDDDLHVARTDPELSLIKERYRKPFKRALRASIGELADEQRELLKLHFVEGVTLDALAARFSVHRATIARWIARARDAVFDRVRARLRSELGLDEAEFDELLVVLRSRLELSLSALKPRDAK
jgi:RNA polymerase sigma-70 factor, ECF subfamily